MFYHWALIWSLINFILDYDDMHKTISSVALIIYSSLLSRHDFRWRSNAHCFVSMYHCFSMIISVNKSHENKFYRIKFIVERKNNHHKNEMLLVKIRIFMWRKVKEWQDKHARMRKMRYFRYYLLLISITCSLYS